MHRFGYHVRPGPPLFSRMGGDIHDTKAMLESLRCAEMVIPILRFIRGPGARDLIDQIARAVDSIAANLAEGFGKGFCQDNIRFQKIAISSCAEAETRLKAAVRSRRLVHSDAEPAIQQLMKTRAMLVGYMRWTERRIRELDS